MPLAKDRASARTIVSAWFEGSFQPNIGSMTRCRNSGSEASHWRSALLVGMSPKRTTSSGASSEGRRRAIASYGQTTSFRS